MYVGKENPDERSSNNKSPRSVCNDGHERQHIQRRSKSVSNLGIVEREKTRAAEELYQLICKNGGSMRMNTALSKLSTESQLTVNPQSYDQSAISFLKDFENRFTVRDDGYTVEAVICINFCKRQEGCPEESCRDLHLCPFNILRECVYKDFCKRSHDISDKHTTDVFASHGLKNLTLQERRKLLCYIASDPKKSNDWRVPSKVLPKVCIHYNSRKGCKNKEQCPFLHVCRHWVLDKCRFDDRICVRSHEFDSENAIRILERHNMGHMLKHEIRDLLNKDMNVPVVSL